MIYNAFFDRSVEVRIDPTDLTKLPFSIKNLRIAFTIQKQSLLEPNTAKIQIYNMNPTHREAATWKFDLNRQRYGGIVEVVAGYSSLGTALIFKGDIVQSHTVRQGPDLITTIEAMTGIKALESKINQSFPKNTPEQSILYYIMDQLNKEQVKAETKAFIAKELAGLKTKKSSVLAGGAGNLIEWINKKFEGVISLSFDDDGVHATPPGVPRPGVRPVIVGKQTGLLESPVVTNTGVDIRTLLMPNIKTGTPVTIRSETVSALQTDGYYVAEKILHTGDSHEGPFESQISCLYPTKSVA